MHTPNEFDLLTQETVRMSEHLSDREFEEEFFLQPTPLNLDSKIVDILQTENEPEIEQDNDEAPCEIDQGSSYEQLELEYPDAPGVIYCVHKSGTTFTLKGYVCSSIEQAFDDLTMGERASFRALKVEESELDRVEFFEFDSVEQAEIVIDQIFNKRYPLEEDILCNISDPGFSWWYGKTEDGFRINFKSHKLGGAGERMRLGPIGDVVVAHLRLNRLKDHFKFHIPISEIVISEKQFILKSSDGTHPVLKELMGVFETGNLCSDSALLCEIDPCLRLYLKELAAVRRFWLKLELSLTKNQHLLN